MAQTIFFHSRLLCTRNLANAILALALLPFLSVAQDSTTKRSLARPLSNLVFSSTAYFLPGTNLSLRGENLIFADGRSNGEAHGTLRVNVAEMVQLDITNDGTIASAYGNVESSAMWGMKLRVFESGDGRTGVAAMIRSSASAGSTISWPNATGSIANNLAAKGLVRYSYGYYFASAAILLSHGFGEIVSLHAGLAAQQIQIYNVKLETMVPETGETTLEVPQITRQFGLNGFLGVVVYASEQLILLGELQSLPELAPSDNLTGIDMHRAYRSAIAIRYKVKNSLSVFTNAGHVFLPTGNSFTEVRLGAEATVSLQ
jgi:hypothetical protein